MLIIYATRTKTCVSWTVIMSFNVYEKQNPFLGLIILLPIGPLGQTLALNASWDNFNKKNFRVFAIWNEITLFFGIRLWYQQGKNYKYQFGLKKRRKFVQKVLRLLLPSFVLLQKMKSWKKKGRNFVQKVLCLLLRTFIVPKIGRTNMDLIFVFHIILDIQPMSF